MFDDVDEFSYLLEEAQNWANRYNEIAVIVMIDGECDLMLASSVTDITQVIERVHPQWTISF
jgi:hypothetical protein